VEERIRWDEHSLMDNYIDLRIFKSDVEEALKTELTDEQFKDVIFESKDTLMNEIRTDLGLLYDELKHIWVKDPNQMEMELNNG